MPYFSLDPVFTRPRQIDTLADATTSMFADMSLNPAKFGSNEQLRNTYFLVRRTSRAICLHLGKSPDEIALDELLQLSHDLLIGLALKEGIDRKHANIYATGGRKIIDYARNCGWTCDAVVRMNAWQPVRDALRHTKDCAVQLVRFLIATGKTPAETTEADLQSWHSHATKDGLMEDRMLPATADAVLVRFRRRIRRSKLEHLFPKLELKSKKPASYRKRRKDLPLAIRAEIDQLVATRSPRYLPGRDFRKALRPSSIKNMVESICAIAGCLEEEPNQGPFEGLAQMLTTTNLCTSIDRLSRRGLLRQGVQRILSAILALGDQLPDLDCGEVRKQIKQIPGEPKHLKRARAQGKSLPYDALSEVPNELQKLIDAGGLSRFEVAWLLHDRALTSTLHKLLLRQRNLRECKTLGAEGANLVWERLTPQMLHDLIIPGCVRAAYDHDHSRRFLMIKYREEETKGKRAEIEVLSLEHAAVLEAYLDVRQWLLEQINLKRLEKNQLPQPDSGTLFLNRHGRALKRHNLRSHVMRLTRNHAGKAVPPHLWRNVYAAHFRILVAIGVEKDPKKLPKKLWHVDQPTTDIYGHLDRALAGIAMRNQKYRASQQTLNKETSEQLVPPELRQRRAA